jgi:hypothetical protein
MQGKAVIVGLMGAAWVTVGLGISAAQFGAFPGGLELVVVSLALFLAGMTSGLLLALVWGGMSSTMGRRLVPFGYAIFAPVGLLLALLAPVQLDASYSAPSMGWILLVPIVAVAYAAVTVAAGLGLTGGLALAAHSLAARVEGSSS